MDDDAVGDEHPRSKGESAFNRYVAQLPPRLRTHARQDDVARLHLVRPGPAVPWYGNVFGPATPASP